MKIGDSLDPVALGHSAIDIKTLLKDAGYVVPQGSVAKLPPLPPEVQSEINALKAEQEKYAHCLGDSEMFDCQFCKTKNVSEWRKEMATGVEFLTCGDCHKVVEVR